MKRIPLLVLIIFLLLNGNSAYAAKARSIASDADSQYHAKHLKNHLGETTCYATGNYIKARNKANGSKVIGHLEQADEFILLNVQNGWAQIEVKSSAKTSPDSWNGMIGWVDSDYIDCNCNTLAYHEKTSRSSSSPYPLTLPNGWSFSSGAGAWNTELRINPDGSFYGYYHDADGYTLYESYFSGIFSEIKTIHPYIYSMVVSKLQVNGIIGSQYYYNDIQHIISEPAGITAGDTFYIYIPGASKTILSEDHLSWLHGIVEDPLSDHALCNMTTGIAFDPYSEYPENIKFSSSPQNYNYRCTVNNLRVRNAPNGSKILGHLEQNDSFIVTSIVDDWAHILITYAAETSPDSFVGLSGWVSTKYIKQQLPTISNTSWKAAYLNFLSDNDICLNVEDSAVFWLAYIDDDMIPELIIDTRIVAGGCHVLTYQQGKVDTILIGSTGIPSYIENNNLLLDSAGHQGCYYDAVYTIENGRWKQIYYSTNYELPSANYDLDNTFVHTYYIGDQKVTRREYHNTLNAYFDQSKSTKLIYGKSIQYLYDELH